MTEQSLVELYVSTRRRFRRGDPTWDAYAAWIELTHLDEVISIDSALNPHVGCGDVHCDPSDLTSVLRFLPKPNAREHYLVVCRLGRGEPESPGPTCELVGCDMSDETWTSSLLNCGPWRGQLEPLARRVNGFGLLSIDDARQAKKLLPREWGPSEPHARAEIWALFVARP